MEDFVRQALLFDFYGDLLTEHQKSVYGEYIQDNLSISEIAEEAGISRQGIHDMVRRCRGILEDYEDKLHLVERFIKIREIALKIRSARSLDEAVVLSDKIVELL